MSTFDNLWIEKYRPHQLCDIILTEINNSIINNFSSVKEIPNLLLTGKPGIGKTSLAKILVGDVLNCQYMYINASDENGIDTVRTKLTNFARARSLDGNIKVIILDEVDGFTMEAQRALRNTMEEYSEFVRFILTANYHHKVIPAVQSRCQMLDLTPDYKSYIDRCSHILAEEGQECEDIEKIVNRYYPDLRKAVNELQKSTMTSGDSYDKTSDNVLLIENIIKILKPDNVHKLRKHIIEAESQFSADYPELLRVLFNILDESSYTTVKKS